MEPPDKILENFIDVIGPHCMGFYDAAKYVDAPHGEIGRAVRDGVRAGLLIESHRDRRQKYYFNPATYGKKNA